MTKRFTIEKSEWSSDREDQYRKDCETILNKTDAKLKMKDSNIFLLQNGQKIKIVDSKNTKRLWYKAWLYLNNSINK